MGVFEGVGGVDLGGSDQGIRVDVFGGERHGVFSAQTGAFVSLLVLAPGAVAVFFPVGDVFVVETGMALVREVLGDLFEGDAIGDPFADLMADGGRETGDFAAGFAVGGGIAEVNFPEMGRWAGLQNRLGSSEISRMAGLQAKEER